MAIVSVRMDDDTKKKFDAFCSSVGITISAAVNMFAKMTIREDRLPFDVKGTATSTFSSNSVQAKAPNKPTDIFTRP